MAGKDRAPVDAPDTCDFLSGGGEMGERIRVFDWSSTPLGPKSGWSPALRTMLRILLANRFPHILWWGPHYIQFYNDPYRPIPGAKHPDKALGRPASECWSEIWHVIGPLIDRPFSGGPATWDDDIYLEINRHGFVEECHFTIAYSPVPDEKAPNGIGGVLATVHEITGKVVGDRRVLVLRDLGAQSAEARTAEDACGLAGQTLAVHSKDIPFALLYLIDPDRRHARLAGSAGAAQGERAAPSVLPLEGEEADHALWPLGRVMQSERLQVVSDLIALLGDHAPPGPWTDRPHTAAVIPIRSNKAHFLAGFMVAGISPRLELDEPYRDFLGLVSTQIATAIANAREYEEEKKRAEALAEIDRAKTTFFSNVSHEFRTPLTLMLGPVEDLLATSHTGLSPAAKGQLEVVNRNGLRLLRLVNTLLDFSRIEAGRVQAVYEPTDLAAFTTELASVFGAATERAGLRLSVQCPKLSEPVHVDRDMWEKVVLNLISNAFKFTLEGEIEVSLRAVDGAAELRVRDTGVGIPVEELPRIFDRFHRVQNMRSRTHEGSGIGLALVQELIKLHGGTVHAESRLNEGTTFIVTVPLGKDHLPPDRIGATRNLASTAVGAAPFVEEALRWLPEQSAIQEEPIPNLDLLPVPCPPHETDENRPRIIVADDNADMRQYLARILAERYNVQTVADGQAALKAARERRPDLILSDVMMPGLDGFGVVREIRGDDLLKTVPVILLSARAGEESRVEGLQHGADDYLIKPFSARELMARVGAHLDLARVRKQSEESLRDSESRLRALFNSTEEGIITLDRDMRCLEANPAAGVITGVPHEQLIGRSLQEFIDPHYDLAGAWAALLQNRRFKGEVRIRHIDGTFRRVEANGFADLTPGRYLFVGHDITERKQAEEALRESERRYKFLSAELEHRVRERTAELERKNLELQEFAFVASHDLAEPLRKIQTFGDLLRAKGSDHLNELEKDYISRMTGAAGRMQELLDALLRYSRIETKGEDFRPTRLKDVALEVVGDLEVGIRKTQARVEVAGLPTVIGDRNQLRQLLQNLVANALKYHRSEVRPRVKVYGEEDQGGCRILVEDNGIGFDEKYLDKIFQPFQRLHGKNEYPGTGIGLAICKKIVERHGGTITAKSTPGKGSTFIVTLPIEKEK